MSSDLKEKLNELSAEEYIWIIYIGIIILSFISNSYERDLTFMKFAAKINSLKVSIFSSLPINS